MKEGFCGRTSYSFRLRGLSLVTRFIVEHLRCGLRGYFWALRVWALSAAHAFAPDPDRGSAISGFGFRSKPLIPSIAAIQLRRGLFVGNGEYLCMHGYSGYICHRHVHTQRNKTYRMPKVYEIVLSGTLYFCCEFASPSRTCNNPAPM